MATVVGIIVGMLAGLLLGMRPRAFVVTAGVFVGGLVLQTWRLGTGRGWDDAGTIRTVEYWIFQVFSLALALGLTWGVAKWRSRTTAPTR